MPQRILHIIPSLDRAGAEKQLTLLCSRLERGEFDVHVSALTRGGPLECELRQAGIPVTVIGKRWKADPVSFARLRNHIRALQPDLVHTWMFAAGAYGRQAARSCGVPGVVASERCVDRWKARWQWWIDRRLAAFTDRIIANTAAVRDYCVEHGMPEDKFCIIPNGIEPAAASDVTRSELLRELGLPTGSKLIAAIGRLWPQKRVRDLVWVAELLHLLRKDFHFLIIGDGPQREALARYIHVLGVEEFVHLLGHRNDLGRILPHIDVLWLGSDYEGMPNSILEAMAAGVPVVATDIPGNRDLVVPGETGFLCPVRGRSDFCRETDRILSDAELAARLGEAARRRAMEQFGVDRMVAGHARLYRELLE